MLVFGAGLRAQTPDVQTIVDGYLEAIGGAEAWLKLDAVEAKGTAAMQGMEFPFTITTAKGDKARTDVNIQGQTMTQAYDGEVAWQVFPMMGITEPTPMSEDETSEMKEQTFLSEFINYEERGFTVEAVEGKELEGTPTYGLRVTNEEGIDHTYYFDTEYLIPVMMSTVVKTGPQKGIVVETYMSDYQEVEGLLMPMFLEVKIGAASARKLTIKEATLNPEVSDEMFSMPK